MTHSLETRTEPFANFHRNFNQSVLLAQIVRRGGTGRLMEIQDMLAARVQQVTGLDLDTFSSLSREDLVPRVQNLSQEALQETQDVQESANDVYALASMTLPYILHVFLIAIFEAYIQDVTIVMCKNVPNLPKPKPGEPVRDFVDKMLRNKRMQEVAIILEQRFHIDFNILCSKVPTSSEELDKAKVLRNIHIHNGGKVHKDFMKRVNEPNLNIDDYPITLDYVIDIAQKIYMTAFDIDLVATGRYHELPTVIVQFRS